MKDCSQFCDAQTFKHDGSMSASASVESENSKLQVQCTQCTSQCGIDGGGLKPKYRRNKRYSNKKNKTKKRKNNKLKKTRKVKKQKKIKIKNRR